MDHIVEYSRSSRARCQGDCDIPTIAQGELRYGQVFQSETYDGTTTRWRHWGCVTPKIIKQLKRMGEPNIPGIRDLRPDDQNRIRLALQNGRVDPTDAPSLISVEVVPPRAGSSRKRKTTHDNAGPPTSQTLPSSSQIPARSQLDEADNADDEAPDELYCVLSTQVVGVQYYAGLVGPGEEVVLQREPTNRYDGNAIQVLNIGRTQVGHLPKAVVGKLAPLLDAHMVTVEGIMTKGNLQGGKVYQMDIKLKIYAPGNLRPQIEPRLVWATPKQQGFGSQKNATASSSRNQTPGVPPPPPPLRRNATAAERARHQAQQAAYLNQQQAAAKAIELRQMLSSLEKVDDEDRRSSLLDSLCPKEDILNLPCHPNPPGVENGQLNVNLLKHQKQALQWCIEHEYPELPKKEKDHPVQLWQRKLHPTTGQLYYYNVATKTPQGDAPELGRGALFADAMGLGKTLTMLALIIATKDDVPRDFSNSTLIVVPVSVISNWEKQIEDHCVPESLSVCVYYGNTKSMKASQIAKHDIVITTYQTVVVENPEKAGKKKGSGLFDVKWKRIILDEGHTIRNPKTATAKALCALLAERRWVLTGTPIINSPKDLGSMLAFLQVCTPLDKEEFFKRLLLRPVIQSEPSGVELLKVLMSQICLRRTKEMQDKDGNPLVPLPPVEMIIVPVKLNDDAKKLYDEVETLSKQRFEHYMSAGSNSMVQSNILSMITRMRQIALHPGLVPRTYLDELQSLNDNDNIHGNPPRITVTPGIKERILDRLAQAVEDSEECPICMNIPDLPRITSCSHFFCLPCITEVISRDPKCPMDRRKISISDIFEPRPPTDLTQRRSYNEIDGFRVGSSAKIDQLVHLLQLTPFSEKSLVFSQFTSFLDKIAETLEDRGIPYVRFDGQMSAKRRQETIAQFSVPIKGEVADIQEPTTKRRRTRRDPMEIPSSDEFDGNNDDGEFVMNDDAPSDDDFVDEKSHPSKGRGKSKRNKGKGKARAHSLSPFGTNVNPKIMLISLKAGALGLNLTVANNVYLMDPWWQEGIESQAVDRVNRIGQKKPVHVYQLIAEDTVESKVIDIQNRKKALIKQAFSGIKATETQRNQKKARLQDLIELFGIRRRQAGEHDT